MLKPLTEISNKIDNWGAWQGKAHEQIETAADELVAERTAVTVQESELLKGKLSSALWSKGKGVLETRPCLPKAPLENLSSQLKCGGSR